MTTHLDAHKGLHGEEGALRGERPGRSRNPLIKVRDLAWLEFEKPDLTRAEAFARAFGFSTAFAADNRADVDRLASATNVEVDGISKGWNGIGTAVARTRQIRTDSRGDRSD